MKKLTTLFCIALLLISVNAFGDTYYMDAAGTAANHAAATATACGDANNLKLTIALHEGDSGNVVAGDMFKLCDNGGIFRDQLDVPVTGTEGNIITYEAATGESPIISGADLVAPGASWSVYSESVWTAAAQTGDAGANNANNGDMTPGWNERVIVLNASISNNGTQVRVQFKGSEASTTYIDKAYIGVRNGTSDDFTSSPTQLLFSSAAAVTITAGNTAWSDWVAFTINSSNDHLVSWWYDADTHGTTMSKWAYDDSTTCQYFKDDSADEAGNTTVAGYSTWNDIDNVADIEARITNVWKATVNTQPYVVMFDGNLGTLAASMTAVDAEYEWFWASNVLYVYSTSDPDTNYTTPGIESAVRSYCIYQTTKDYITYSGITLKQANSWGFRGDSDDDHLTFTSVTSQYNRYAGFLFDDSDYVTMTSCVSSYNGRPSHAWGVGYQFNGAGNTVLLTNCEAGHNSQYGFASDPGITGPITITGGEYHNTGTGTDSDGIKIASVTNGVTIEQAYIHDNWDDSTDGDGIQFVGTASPTVKYCLFKDNYNTGIILNSSIGGSIYENIFNHTSQQGGAISIETNATNTLNIYNNSFYNNLYGIMFITASPTAQVNIKNNIQYGGTAASDRCLIAFAAFSDTHVTLDHNYYYQSGPDFLVEDWGGNNHATLAAFVSGESQDANSTEADPLFTNSAGDDFTLTHNSPCIDQGVDLGSSYDDTLNPISSWPDNVYTIDQDLHGTGWNIGAYGFYRLGVVP